MFLVSPVEQDKYFHSLCIVHNSSYSQFSNLRFLKETKHCRIKFNTIRIPSRKKIATSPPPNRKAHFNKKIHSHIMLSIYMSDCKIHYLIKQIMKLMMNCDFKSICTRFLCLKEKKCTFPIFFFFLP